MKSMLFALVAILTFSTACSNKSVKVAETQKYQEVEFSESEVPYIQAVKKDGKMSAIIVPASASEAQKN